MFKQFTIDAFMKYVVDILGPVSISDKTSYRKTSLSLEAARFILRTVRSLWHLTGKFQNDATILTTNPAASRLHQILRYDVL